MFRVIASRVIGLRVYWLRVSYWVEGYEGWVSAAYMVNKGVGN